MELYPETIETIRPPEQIPVWKWIEKHRVLNKKSSSETGLKRVSRTPALKILYDWFEDPKIREVVVQKPAQIGLTDLIVDLILWIAVNDPSPTALFLADQDTARKIMKFRIEPSLREMGLISEKGATESKDITKFEVNLNNGFYLAVAWGSSISQTASMSFKRVFCDEVNKPGYDVVKAEGDTLDRIRERMETYHDSKFFIFSTPTTDTGNVTKEFNDCEAQYDHCCPCPNCGAFQPLSFPQVVWSGDGKLSFEELENTVRYKCFHCGALWTENERIAAVEAGKAMLRKETANHERVGYQLHRLVSLFKGGNMARMAYNFLRAKDEPGKLQNIVNSVFGEPFIQKLSKVTEKDLEILRKPLARGVVPDNTLALVAGIDSQHTGVWFVVRAFNKVGGSTLIDYGYLPGDNDDALLEQLLYEREYQSADGKKWRIWRAFRDVGGGENQDTKVSITERVMIWLRNHKDGDVQLFGCRGANMAMEQRVKLSKPIDTTPSGRTLRGSIQLVRIDTQKMKDSFYYRLDLARRQEENGAYLCEDVADDWFKHVTAEQKRLVKGREKWVLIRSDNHLFDCEIYCHSAIERCFLGGIAALKRPMYSGKRRVIAAPVQPQKQENTKEEPINNPLRAPRESQPNQNPYLSSSSNSNPYLRGGRY